MIERIEFVCSVCKRKKTKSIALKRTGRECQDPEVGANLGLAPGVLDVGRRRN